MPKKLAAGLAAAAVAAVTIASLTTGTAASTTSTAGQPVMPDPSRFVSVVDNPYYPLPVGRVLVYRGVRDGKTQTDRVTVTARTKTIMGIEAVVVKDVARHKGDLLEKTFDWFAQDDVGNVWYLGEDTKAYLRNGTVDRSGSWEAGKDGAVAGIIMKADPRIPDSYRQEYRRGEAEDTAWVVGRGGSVRVPYGTVRHVLTSLEHTRLEPKVVDKKVYAPGIGIVLERSLAGGQEVAKLVKVIG